MRRSTLARVAALFAVALLLLAVLAPVAALGRAGGGHVGGGGGSFSGGGGGMSGGSPGGGSTFGGGVVAPIPIPLGGGFGSCCLFLVVIAVVVGVVFYLRRRGGDGSSPFDLGAPITGGPSPLEAAPGEAPADAFAQVKAHDPAFNEEMFYGRVNEMFIAIQYAWMNRDMEPARRFLADQQFPVLQQGVQEYVTKGQVNMLENIHIDSIRPVSVETEGDFDVAKLLITATSIDYTIDERTKAVVNPHELGDGKTPSTFQEYWTFIRKVGAQSKPTDTIQKCPNCGAPVTDGNYVKCAYCGTQMNDPSLDWVLMRIEQV